MTAQCWIAAVVGIAAIVDDLARRQISNWIPCSAFAAGLILQTVEGGWRGAGSAAAGNPHWSRSFLDFLSARRHGRRRCEVDGRFWRGPGSQTASGGRLVDGRVWRSDGGGSDCSQSASKILDRKAAGFCNRNRGIGLNARHSARVHPVRSSHSGRSVAESGSKDMRAILHSGSW